ncbi:MAG TPA: hypothetical protein VKH19_08820 [Gemmatimonadaceae bacterium]|nr:hypothetical protein [Gemmatimonadaceae bacterium]
MRQSRRLFQRTIVALALTLAVAPAAHAQTMRDKVSELFIFGGGSNPLHLGGTADPDNPANIRAHGDHFVPAAVSQNGSIITFLTVAVGQSVADVPIGATSSGETFRFEAGVPVKTSTSAGPILAERSETIGRGRAIVGVGHTRVPFTTIRGQDMGNLELIFTHQNVDFPGCDSIAGGSCAQMGLPLLENEVIRVRLSLHTDVSITSFYATYGLFDFLDVSFVLPLMSTHMSGTSEAQIIPFGGTSAVHFFAGTPTDPVLSANRTVEGSSFGLGDVAVRVKALVRQTDKASFALFGDARFATGDEDDLLGAGYFTARGAGALTAHYGPFSPHLNFGYLYRHTETASDAVMGIAGFDHLMAPNVTLAVDVLSRWQVGANKVLLPAPVHIDYPFQRVIDPTSIPNTRDNIVDGSFGFKFGIAKGGTAIVNALVPLNSGGLRARVVSTFGVEYGF